MEKIQKILIYLIISAAVFAQTDYILKSKQIVVVVSENWEDINAKMYLFDKVDGDWIKKIDNIDIVFGHKGLAWGRGLLSDEYIKGKIKKEGDSCAPAGIFKIYRAFGYLPKDSLKLKIDYFTSDTTTFCIDDPNSQFYNMLVDVDTIKQIDWKRKERLKLKSDAYKYCIVVEHNTENIVKYGGSCIFIHLWIKDKKNPERYEPTMGCTSLSEDAALELLQSLDSKLNPILIQVPKKEYEILRKKYNFPNI